VAICTKRGTPQALSTRASTALVAAGAGLLTLLAGVTSVIDLAYFSPRLHIAVETAATLISLLAAQLILGRYGRSTQLADLLLGSALIVLAFGNLALSAIPAILDDEGGALGTWGALAVRTIGAMLLALAAWTPMRPIIHPARAARMVVAGGGSLIAGIVLAVAVAGDALPSVIPEGLAAEGPERPRLGGNPVVLALQLASTLLFAVAAVGFARRAERTGDKLFHWLAIAAALGAFSRLNYLIYPSLGTSWFFTGDVLRLAFFLALLVAGVQELRWTQRQLAETAVLRERQRIARDIHDGVAQDLAFLVHQARALRRKLGPTPVIEQMITAAQRALDESRDAVATLFRPPTQPLSDALAQTAREAAEREGSTVDTDLAPDVTVPGPTQEAMLRILREAVINAARHGGARRISVRLRDEPKLCLSVSDDGRGFDVEEAVMAPGRHGLRGMAERVEDIGGELRIESEPGRGTQVRVVVE
jgi:signal transduction histidine kinase